VSTPTPAEPPRGTYTTQLLVDLATNPLDPGYAAAAARRGDTPKPPGVGDRAAVAAGALLIGFLLIVAYVHTNRGAPEAAKVHDRLVARVNVAERDAGALATQAQRLNASVAAARDLGLSGSGLGAQLDRNQLLAGEVAVTGPGLEVVLGEPSGATSPTAGRAGSGSIGATHILTDRDVRSVVNELWADGAEAVSVNGIRLTPTSAIRFAGEAVLVDFQPITSPYTVRAIGAADNLATAFASSSVASRYQTLISADGITFSFTGRSKLSLPAATGASPRYAQAGTAPTPSPTPTPGGTR
jgi:uncharacterized protein YlxW (UPF0749 family)